MIYIQRYICLALTDILLALSISFCTTDPFVIASLILLVCIFRESLRLLVSNFIGKSEWEKTRSSIKKDIKMNKTLVEKQAVFILTDYEHNMPDISP